MNQSPDLCVPLQPKSLEELERSIQEAETAGATMVEVWLDALPGKERNLQSVRAMTKLKLLGVCKPQGEKEKGNFQGTEAQRIQILKDCITHDFDIVDVGMTTTLPINISQLIRWASRKRAETEGEYPKVSLSYHSFDENGKTEEELRKIVGIMSVYEPDIYKIAVKAKNLEQVATLIQINAGLQKQSKSPIILPMGDWSWVRALAPELGAPLIFTAIDQKRATAPGQITIAQYRALRDEINSFGIDAALFPNMPKKLRSAIELLLKQSQ